MREFNKAFNITLGIGMALIMVFISCALLFGVFRNYYPDLFVNELQIQSDNSY